MSRITKSIAENVATKLTDKQAREIKELKEGLILKFTEIYLNQLPEHVKSAFGDHPDYFKQRISVNLNGNGFNWDCFYFTQQLPCTGSTFEPSAKDASILVKISNNIEAMEKEFKQLKLEIETLVFGLRTYAKVKSEFPEAAPFLPETTSTALMVNISDLRKKLK